MYKTGVLIVGCVLIVAGLVFALQGFDVLKGSAMSGTNRWAILGPVIAVVGIALVLVSRRRR